MPLITSSAAFREIEAEMKRKRMVRNRKLIMMMGSAETGIRGISYSFKASRKRKISESLEAGLEAVKRGNR
jgi:hypothetical protein